MREVLSIVESTDASSLAALKASEEVSQTAETLRSEVTDFLTAVSHGDDAERRLYERIPAGGIEATMRIGGRQAVTVAIEDISRGGIALRHECADRAGTEVEVNLPGGGLITGRIARIQDGSVGITFRQDEASLVRIDQTLASIRNATGRRAA